MKWEVRDEVGIVVEEWMYVKEEDGFLEELQEEGWLGLWVIEES